MWRFEIPFGLVVKKNSRPIFKNKKTGKVFLGKSARLKDFEQSCEIVLRAQKNVQGIKAPIEGALRLTLLKFEFKGAQRADVDNLISSVFDALQDAGVIQNDKQFRLLTNIYFVERAGRDHTTIEFGPYE